MPMFFKIVLIQGSFWDLMKQASLFHWVILLILAFMSLVSWGILINKWRTFRGVTEDSRRFLAIFRRRNSLRDVKAKLLAFKRSPMGRLFEEGFREFEIMTESQRSVSEVHSAQYLGRSVLGVIERGL
jgi:biopolymer transport protein TolQ